MNASYIIMTTIAYFLLIYAISRVVSKKSDNDTFFRGNRQSPWWAVAFGMIGASISGVSFVSVPGMVTAIDMTYMQMCIGFFFGYIVVAFVLLPIYYRLNLTSIYTYLDLRFGKTAYRTGASFFLLSKMLGAAARLYIVCLILQQFVFSAIGIPFWLTATCTVLLIWLYTSRNGIKAIVWTDALQTLCLILALLWICYEVCRLNNFTVTEAINCVANSPNSRWFEWNDWNSPQHFLKQFLSGIFIVIVMTGLDQDMMQKNLTCKNLKDAQKDMCTYGFVFIPLNLLLLALGILLLTLATNKGIDVPARGDDLLPLFCAEGHLGYTVLVLFTIGIIAAAFSSADSALTALTTAFCVDILEVEHRFRNPERTRKITHATLSVLFVAFILLFKAINSSSVIDAIFIMASYTYGPLLGLFTLGMFTNRQPYARITPIICIASPVICYLTDMLTQHFFNYKFGYELLLLNGLLTFSCLYVFSRHDNLKAENSLFLLSPGH